MSLLRMYGHCLGRLPGDLARSLWALLLPMGYFIAFQLVGTFIGLLPLGIIGGFIMGFVAAALLASFLYIVDEMVSRSPVKPAELVTSVRRYFWPVVNVLFVFWIKDLVLDAALSRSPNGAAISQALSWLLLIVLNATPEVIYQRRLYGGLDILQAAVIFLQEHWIEWFIPNLVFVGALYYGVPWLLGTLFVTFGPTLGLFATGVVLGLVLLPMFIFRGHLFQELDSGSARQRRFRYGR